MKNKFVGMIPGLLGFLGILGYVLNEPAYYVFFAFFLNLYPVFLDLKKGESKISIYKLITWFGSGLLILSGVILIVTRTTSYVLGVIVLVGIFAFMIGFYEYIGMDEPKDERLKKIGTTATTYSWHLTLLIICSILISSIWSGDKSISIASLGLILFVMVATMLGVNIYLNRKGDVN